MDLEVPRKKERNLHILRAIAVLCVVVSHFLQEETSVASGTDVLGRVGVLIFFVLTSYVLMGSCQALYKKAPERNLSWILTFYRKRLLRIYPLSVVVVTLTYAVNEGMGVHHSFTMLVANLLLIQNLVGQKGISPVLWTLCIEVQMYVFLPFLFFLAHGRINRVLIAMVVAVLMGLMVISAGYHATSARGMLEFAPCFVTGVLVYAISHHYPERYQIDGKWWLPLVFFTIVVFAGTFRPGWGAPSKGWPLCLALGGIILLTRDMQDSRLTRVAEKISLYSYGLYLLHKPLLYLAFEGLDGVRSPVKLLAYVALLCTVPVFMYYVIEERFMRLGDKTIPTSSGRKTKSGHVMNAAVLRGIGSSKM